MEVGRRNQTETEQRDCADGIEKALLGTGKWGRRRGGLDTRSGRLGALCVVGCHKSVAFLIRIARTRWQSPRLLPNNNPGGGLAEGVF